VGKSNLALNLAFALNQKGAKVLLMDCDFGLANLDVLLGITPSKNIQNILNGNLKPSDVLVSVSTDSGRAFDLLPASSGVAGNADDQRKMPALLGKKINVLAGKYDYVLMDIGAGISPTVLNFAAMSMLRVMVITPEPTSLTDSYALIKVLSTSRGIRDYLVLVNQIENSRQEAQAFQRLSAACTHFLNISPICLGSIPVDSNLPEAVRRQKPLLREFPASKSVKYFFTVAEKLNKLRASMLARIAGLPPLSAP
jgi:flagellar biosynthesis protein FlhG